MKLTKLERWDKIYLDKDKAKESEVNTYLDCRDGIVEAYEYRDESGYGSKTRLFLCSNTKHESKALIRQVYSGEEWNEESMYFDSDSFDYLKAIVNGNKDELGGKYTLIRDY